GTEAEPARMRGRRPIFSRATSSARVGDEVRTRARRRCGTRDRHGRLHARRGVSCSRDAAAARVAAVRQIAVEKRGVTPRLTRTGYLQASGAALPPPEFRKDWKLSSIEGFLFPATYEFTKLTSSARLVSDQLRAFRRNWRKVGLG